MSSRLQKISSAQKRRTRRLRMRRAAMSLGSSSSTKISPTSTLKMSTSPTLTSPTSTSISPLPTLTPSQPKTKAKTTTTQEDQILSPSMSLPQSPKITASSSSKSVDTATNPQAGATTRDTLSNFDLDIDMLASRAFARDGTPRPRTTALRPPPGLERSLGLETLESLLPPPPPASHISPTATMSTPKIIIDDYIDDVSLQSDSSQTSHRSTLSSLRSLRLSPSQSPSPRSHLHRSSTSRSTIEDHYELVIMPQLEIILDAVRAMQAEVTHLHNEVMDLKVTSRHAHKKIWEYLNFTV